MVTVEVFCLVEINLKPSFQEKRAQPQLTEKPWIRQLHLELV